MVNGCFRLISNMDLSGLIVRNRQTGLSCFGEETIQVILRLTGTTCILQIWVAELQNIW